MKRDKTKAILDITHVLLQVYKKIDSEKYPEILINKMVNYIYIVGFDNKIHFLGNDEKLLIELGDISKKAGIMELTVNIKLISQTSLNSIVILKKYLLGSNGSVFNQIITKSCCPRQLCSFFNLDNFLVIYSDIGI